MEKYIELMILGISLAGITMFFQRCLHPRMIFHWYMLFLARLSKKNTLMAYITKLIGLCPYCYGFWLVIASYIYIYNFNIYIVITLGSWYITLELLMMIPYIIWIIPQNRY